jgi:hypothetical protein
MALFVCRNVGVSFFVTGNKCDINPLNAELNPICHLLALLGGATIVVVSRLRVKSHLRDLVRGRWLQQKKLEYLLTSTTVWTAARKVV